MRGLKFLFLLLFLLLTLAGFVAWYNYDNLEALLADFSDIGNFADKIIDKTLFYFSNAGSWNYLILLLMAASFTVLFILNDLLLEKVFHSRQKKSFIASGLSTLFQRSFSIALVVVEFILIANLVVLLYANRNMVTNLSDLKEQQTILLLGTNKKLRSGEGNNLYYTYRIEAVAKLYKLGKVKRIIISGDNGKAGYNEPADMQYSLQSKGVPAHLIQLDYAGFRTLDSVVRLKGHFGIKKALIVSQRFHVERALMLAWLYDVEATGFPAEGGMTVNMVWRELLAKPKALLDVFVFNMQPRYGKTYAKASLDLQNHKDRSLVGVVLFFCLFAVLMVYLFFRA